MDNISARISMYSPATSKRRIYCWLGRIDPRLGSMGSAPGLTVFDSGFRSFMMQTPLASCLYNFKYKRKAFLVGFFEAAALLGIARASCSIFTVPLMYTTYVAAINPRAHQI